MKKLKTQGKEVVIHLTLEIDNTCLMVAAYQEACQRASREGNPPPPAPPLLIPPQEDAKIGQIVQVIRIPR